MLPFQPGSLPEDFVKRNAPQHIPISEMLGTVQEQFK
jgi:hypothetical protein